MNPRVNAPHRVCSLVAADTRRHQFVTQTGECSVGRTHDRQRSLGRVVDAVTPHLRREGREDVGVAGLQAVPRNPKPQSDGMVG